MADRTPHPGFHAHEPGEKLAGCTVVRRAESSRGNACWVVIASCGHEDTVQGIALRTYAKEGRALRCQACRAPTRHVDSLRADKLAHPEKYSKVCMGPCGAEKPLTEFSINRARPDCRNVRCKACLKLALLANDRLRLEHMRRGLPPPKLGKFCGVCCNLEHQRPVDGCPGCGQPFRAEDLTEVRQECRERRRVVERG